MKEKKQNTFIFNEDWGEAIDVAPTDEQLSIYRAIRKYAVYGEDTELPSFSKGIMSTIKLQIDRNNKKYEEVKEKRSAAGKAGNIKRWGEKKKIAKVANIANATKCDNSEQMSQSIANVANIADNDNVNDNINNINVINKPKGYEKYNFSFVEEQFKNVFYKWLDYKRTRGEKYKAQSSLETSYKKLKELSNNNPADAEKIVDNSIANNWAGIFPLRDLFGRDGINTGKIQKEGFEWKQ